MEYPIDALVDSLTSALRRQLIDLFPPERAASLHDLQREPMDPLVGRFLAALMDQHGENEVARVKYEPSEWVDAEEQPAVRQSLDKLRDTIRQSIRFPASRWEPLLTQAVTTICNYVVAPPDTMLQHLFELDSTTIAAPASRKRLGAFAAYPSFLDEVVGIFDDDDRGYERHEVEEAVSAVAHSVGHDTTDWATFSEPLFALHQRVNSVRAVPLPRLVSFVSQFGRADLIGLMESFAEDYNRTEFSEDDLLRSLVPRRVTSVEDLASTEMPEGGILSDPAMEPSHGSSAGDGIDQTNGVSERHASSQPSQVVSDPIAPQPLWKQFQQKLNAPMGNRVAGSTDVDAPSVGDRATGVRTSRTAHPSTQTPLFPMEDERSTKPLWLRYTGGDEETSKPLTTEELICEFENRVFGGVDDNRRGRFVAELFEGNDGAYEDILGRLAEADNWAEASSIIANDVFRRFRINIYSDVAVSFTNAVERRFLR